MNANDLLHKAVSAASVPIDLRNQVPLADKFYLLAQVADERLLRVNEFYGLALLAISTISLDPRRKAPHKSWLRSGERKQIEKFFRLSSK